MNCTLGGGTEADMVFAIRELTGGLDGGKIEIQPNEALIGASPDKGRQEGGGALWGWTKGSRPWKEQGQGPEPARTWPIEKKQFSGAGGGEGGSRGC